MMYNFILVLALAVFGTSANLLSSGTVVNGGYGARVSDVCRCVKTVVRPHIRSEITNIPTVHSFVRTETTPVVERIPYSVSRRVDAPIYARTGIISGNIFPARIYSDLNGSVYSGSGGLSGASTFNGGYINGNFNGFSNGLY